MMKSPPETSLDVTLSEDASGFVRRACPSCGRHFKVAAQGESSILLAALAGELTHANAVEIHDPGCRRCAYCGYRADAAAFLTPPQRHWLERCAKRLDVEVQFVRLRALDPYSSVAFEKAPEEVSAEHCPPEPDDMQQVPMWCCGERLKLKPGWTEVYFCPRCGQRQGAFP